MRLGIMGAGRMGWSLAKLGRHFGDSIDLCIDIDTDAATEFAAAFACLWAKSPNDAKLKAALLELDAICLSVNDEAISSCAKTLAGKLSKDCIVFHTSGVLGSDVLREALSENACASLHPLAPCPLKASSDSENLDHFKGLYYAVEGDEAALILMRKFVQRLEGKLVAMMPQDKAKYHAAAVFASNYPLALVNVAARLFQACAFEKKDAYAAAKSLFLRASHNLAQTSLGAALTGPAKRGDHETINLHLEALSEDPSLELYNLLLDESYQMIADTLALDEKLESEHIK
ncbi:MAG: DUF2520 domain-containing protein [Bradymonadales bacterium]|jgi:predicted short-subunit dehydrogenase-like oxidoreductase (DUF2520 family)